MKLCVDNSVSLSFYSPHGKFIARLQGPVTGNVLLRQSQHRLFSDDSIRLHLSSLVISGKLYNSRVTLRRFIRDHSTSSGIEEVESCAEMLNRRIMLAKKASSIEILRGIEGDGASIYFKALPNLILNPEPKFRFINRNRRPPTDAVNAMLSFGYSLLAGDCTAALEGVGLDPAIGFMHAIRPGRDSLALDLMEEMRSYIVDRHVISMINNRQISPADFLIHTETNENGEMAVILNDNGRKKFLTAWQNRKKKEITHPFLNEKISIGLLPHVQALLLARYMRGDINDYPVFFSK